MNWCHMRRILCTQISERSAPARPLPYGANIELWMACAWDKNDQMIDWLIDT